MRGGLLALAAVGAALAAGCAAERARPAPAAATYAATVPCAADCATVAYRITLFADGSYWYERRQLGLDGATRHEFREVGRVEEVDGAVVLHGTRDRPERWRRVTDAALRLEGEGGAVGGGSTTAIVRQDLPDREFGPVRLRGTYQRDGIAGTLASCESRARYLVVGGEGAAELGLEYARAVPRETAPLLVALQARFVPRAAGADPAAPAPIMVESFERSAPGAGCGR